VVQEACRTQAGKSSGHLRPQTRQVFQDDEKRVTAIAETKLMTAEQVVS
jgi:hypothetical protein